MIKNCNSYHVVPWGHNWAIYRKGSVRASYISAFKRDALSKARKLAKKNLVDLFIHGTDGRISKVERYKTRTEGNDA